MTRRSVFGTLAILVAVTFAGCAMRPKTFVQSSGLDPVWSSIEIRQDMPPEKAWEEVVDVLAKKFDLEMISKEGLYIRTAWTYSWLKGGEVTQYYRVRAIVKFAPDHKRVDLKTEANYLQGDQWMLGYDTLLLQTLKTDIMGVLARTTR